MTSPSFFKVSVNRHCARPHAYTISVDIYLERVRVIQQINNAVFTSGQNMLSSLQSLTSICDTGSRNRKDEITTQVYLE